MNSNFKIPFGRLDLPLSLLILSLALVAVPLHAAGLRYRAEGKPDAIALLAPPPLPGSLEQAADLEEVRAVDHAATSNDITAASAEHKFTIFNFTPDIEDFF